MKLAILKVILWHRSDSFDPRVVEFLPGKINVITGESGSGKSSLTSIIDYCLGSDKCAIPVGLIREVTEWFGLHIQLANTQLVVARRNPEGQQTTTDLYWQEGIELTVPHRVEKNARVEDLKSRLGQLARLSMIELASIDTAPYGGRASFRDMAAFNFQPQHIVANPYTFFFKADTTEHREKLRVVFPLALGAVTANDLALQRELKDAEREHEKLQRELEARLRAARAWEAEVESYFFQAKALGLIAPSIQAEPSWPLEQYLLQLQKVPVAVHAMDLPDVAAGTGEAAAADLRSIVGDEDRLSQEFGETRRRLSKIELLNSSVDEYGTTLTAQQDRMQGVGWFTEKVQGEEECPVCGSTHSIPAETLARLRGLATELNGLSRAIHEAPPKLDEEMLALRQELRERETALNKVRHKRKALEAASAGAAAQRQQVRQIYLFVGRVEQALENLQSSRNVSDLRAHVEHMANHISALRSKVDPRVQRERLSSAIEAVSRRVEKYAHLMNLEHASENVRLNIKELTLEFHPNTGRTDFLWEVGSGQNWVGYHMAGILALHEYFATLEDNHVPNFLLIDQPSQVYFPEAWPSIDDAPISADITGVKRIFQTLGEFMKKRDFQLIVTEHAGSIAWEGIESVHVAGNWRLGHDEFLVPAAWLS
jgi:energy-coupling factor transporter ATP-binding protein EcfA2